jgi:hypothetical protein
LCCKYVCPIGGRRSQLVIVFAVAYLKTVLDRLAK